MTPQFEAMLRIFGDGATGNVNKYPGDIDSDAVVSLAHIQGVWTVVYPALAKVCDVSKYHLQFLAAVRDGVRRNEFTFNALQKIKDEGIEVCLLKGASVAALYNEPHSRISSDVDILINPKDEKKVLDILLKNGYSVEKRSRYDHHTKATHPVGGLLEVHVGLYSRITEKAIFSGADMYNEEWIDSEADGKKFKTLGINDNLNYLTAHYIKHFIKGGSSIRQMMDLLLYLKKYENQIDFEKYNRLLKELKYEKLINAVKSIGGMYFGLDFEITEPELMKDILEDCASFGLFGYNSSAGGDVYGDYCRMRKSMTDSELRYEFMFRSEQSVFGRLFPSKDVLLKHGYSYAKHSVLVPFGWAHSLFDALLRRFNPQKNHKEANERKNNRTNLMKKLEMID